MDQLRQIFATIARAIGRLSVSQKLLIGTVTVILLMTLLLVSVYAGRSSTQPLLPGQAAESQQAAARVLATSGIRHMTGPGGEVMVSPDDADRAMAAVMQSGQAPANTELVFDNILKSQNWINSKEQNRQIYNVMRNNWLAGVIGKFKGVKSAQVLVDAPEQVGFGAPQRAPKASVTLFSSQNQPLPQETIDAAARFVSGSVSGLDVQRVEVIDGTLGRPRTVTDEREPAAASAREHARQIEKDWRQKIMNLLPGIDGVAVEVTAVVDASRKREQVSSNLPMGQGSLSTPKREQNSNNTSQSSNPGVEPGLRSNVGADVNQGRPGSGPRTSETKEETEYSVAVGTRVENIEHPGGGLKTLAATVAIPRSFIAALIQRDKAAAQPANQPAGAQQASTNAEPPAPTDQEIQARFAAERTSIESLLRPHFRVETAKGEVVQGEVVVALMSGDANQLVGGGGGGGSFFGGGSASGSSGGALGTVLALGGGVIDKVVLGALALVALAMMLMMTRKASRQVEIPTAEELVGLPPPLDPESDVVGEADVGETAMAGIELGETEIKVGKMREQVAELVKSQPELAAGVLQRWITPEE